MIPSHFWIYQVKSLYSFHCYYYTFLFFYLPQGWCWRIKYENWSRFPTPSTILLQMFALVWRLVEYFMPWSFVPFHFHFSIDLKDKSNPRSTFTILKSKIGLPFYVVGKDSTRISIISLWFQDYADTNPCPRSIMPRRRHIFIYLFFKCGVP